MTDDISSDEEQRGKGRFLTFMTNHAFNEIVRCPRYYASTRPILLSRLDPDPSVSDCLLGDFHGAKGHLL
jgi:hypothetical protein